MLTINPYLNFAGNTEEAFNFYKSVFGGEFLALQRFKDTPEPGNIQNKSRTRSCTLRCRSEMALS